MEEASCYELCQTPPSFLGVTPAVVPDEHGQGVLLTSVTDGVQLLHAEKSDYLRSWSSSLEKTFTSPCVLQNGRLYAVQNEKTICSWELNDQISGPLPKLPRPCSSSSSSSTSSSTSSALSASLLSLVPNSSSSLTKTPPSSSVRTREYPDAISKLYPNPNNPAELVVVFTNGNVAVVNTNPDISDQFLESLVTSKIPKGKGTMLASSVQFHQDRIFVASLRIPASVGPNAEAECYMNVYIISMNQGSRKIDEVGHYGFRAPRMEDCEAALGLPHNAARSATQESKKVVTPVAFDWQLQSRTLGFVWSNGIFQALKFEPLITHAVSLSRAPREAYLRPLSDFHIPSLSLAFIGTNFIGITGHTLSGGTQFLVLETLYGTMPVPAISLVSKLSPPLLTSSSTTSVTPSTSKKRKSSAAAATSALSLSSSSSPSFPPSSIAVSTDGLYCFCISTSVWVVQLPTILPSSVASLAVAMGHLKEFPALAQPPVHGRLDLLRALIQVNEKNNLTTVVHNAIKDCDQNEHNLFEILEAGDPAKIKKEVKGFLSANRVSHNLLTRIAERTLALHCWTSFELVLKTQLFSARNLPHFVSVLVEHKQIRALELCVARVHDLDDSHLVQVLQFGLQQSPPVVSLVDAVLAARHSASFLHTALKSLLPDVLASLLDHLVKWFGTYWEAPHDKSHAVALPQVVDWCSVMLDAAFIDLILPSSPCHRQLLALQEAVSLHMSLANALTKSAGVLKALCSSIEAKRAGKKVEPKPSVADYSVEFLLL